MTHPIIRPLLAVLLLGCANAHAGDAATFRNVTGVGPWIAEQGNQALRELAREFQEKLAERLRPALPPAPAPEDAAASRPARS